MTLTRLPGFRSHGKPAATRNNSQNVGGSGDNQIQMTFEGYATGEKACPAAIIHWRITLHKGVYPNGSRVPGSNLSKQDFAEVQMAHQKAEHKANPKAAAKKADKQAPEPKKAPKAQSTFVGLKALFDAPSVNNNNRSNGKNWYLLVDDWHIIKVDNDLKVTITKLLQKADWQKEKNLFLREKFCNKFGLTDVKLKKCEIDCFTLQAASRKQRVHSAAKKGVHALAWNPFIFPYLAHQSLRRRNILREAQQNDRRDKYHESSPLIEYDSSTSVKTLALR